MSVAADQLKEAVEHHTESGKYVSDYSGRYMYGEKCIGFTVDNQLDVFYVLLAISQNEHELAEDMLGAMRTDNMGMGTIYYFPGFE